MSREPAHVVLVEDNADHAELVRRVLLEDGGTCRITHFTDGTDALDGLLGRGAWAGRALASPDLILLDLRLTRVDGMEVLRAVKRHEDLRAIPVVVLTSSEAARDIASAYQEHVNSYLVKPVGFEEFRELMNDLRCYWLGWNATPADRPRPGGCSPA